jgi:uncharacterized membrane protein YhhN
MNKVYWLTLFVLVLAINIAGIQLNNETVQWVTKPLIIPALAGYFLSQTSLFRTGSKNWILAALFFSWAGDVLLMFVPKNEVFFLAGLGSFLVAHIFYIVFFHQLRVREDVKPRALLLVIVVIYYATLITWLSPYLAEMKIPVYVYGLVISFMLMLALHMLYIKNKAAGKWLLLGAVLFVVSDSILAINKFYKPIEMAGVLIMLTYGFAQLFIVKGGVRYLNSMKNG